MSQNRYSKPIDFRKFNRDNAWRIDIASQQKHIAGKLIDQAVELSNCPICKHADTELFVEIYGYPFHECRSCGHLFSKKPPTFEAIAALYTEDNKGKVLSAQAQIYIQKDLYLKRVNEIAAPKAKFATEFISKKGVWIDVGAGVGDLVLAAKELGWEAIGYESDKQEVEFAQLMGSNVVNQFLRPENMSILRQATVVSTINVLEHILDPKTLVKSISENISPGAYFLFEVPRFPSISAIANRCFPNLAARNIYSPDHLHLFSDKSAQIMLNEAKFEIQATWFFGQDVYEVFGNMLASAAFANHPLINKALSLTNDMQTVVDKNGLSDTMLVLAKKNG
jgi:2-polyprenyl-3-methyl-5-hydroxy-6-metoxy-1,4-benzoquinol methylase